jgi:hypothetical protein
METHLGHGASIDSKWYREVLSGYLQGTWRTHEDLTLGRSLRMRCKDKLN